MLFEMLMRAHFADEVEAGFPTLRRIPISAAIKFLDYLETVTVADRDSLIEALARSAAMRFSHPAAIRDQMVDPAFSSLSSRHAVGAVVDGAAARRFEDEESDAVGSPDRGDHGKTRSTLDFIPRDDFPPALVPDPDPAHLKPAKAPQLRKLIDAAFKELFAPSKRKNPGGETVYTGVLNETQITVRIVYAGMGLQLRYLVTTPDVPLLAHEDLWGAGQGWDYITEENAEASIRLLSELVKRITSLGLASRTS